MAWILLGIFAYAVVWFIQFRLFVWVETGTSMEDEFGLFAATALIPMIALIVVLMLWVESHNFSDGLLKRLAGKSSTNADQ